MSGMSGGCGGCFCRCCACRCCGQTYLGGGGGGGGGGDTMTMVNGGRVMGGGGGGSQSLLSLDAILTAVRTDIERGGPLAQAIERTYVISKNSY